MIEIIEKEQEEDEINNLIAKDTETLREFNVILPKQFHKNGFRKLNVENILTNKLKSGDFAFAFNSNDLEIYYTITNIYGKEYSNKIICKEIIPDINKEIEKISDTNELKNIIKILNEEIKILSNKIEKLEKNIKIDLNYL